MIQDDVDVDVEMLCTIERLVGVAAHGLGQAHAVFNQSDDDDPNGYPRVGERVEDPQSRAPWRCFPHEVLAATKDSLDQAYEFTCVCVLYWVCDSVCVCVCVCVRVYGRNS